MKVSEISVEELRQLIVEIVEQKLEELLRDPYREMQLREDVKERLKRTAKLKRGIPASEVARKLGTNW